VPDCAAVESGTFGPSILSSAGVGWVISGSFIATCWTTGFGSGLGGGGTTGGTTGGTIAFTTGC
jgi:hypothetical protein